MPACQHPIAEEIDGEFMAYRWCPACGALFHGGSETWRAPLVSTLPPAPDPLLHAAEPSRAPAPEAKADDLSPLPWDEEDAALAGAPAAPSTPPEGDAVALLELLDRARGWSQSGDGATGLLATVDDLVAAVERMARDLATLQSERAAHAERVAQARRDERERCAQRACWRCREGQVCLYLHGYGWSHGIAKVNGYDRIVECRASQVWTPVDGACQREDCPNPCSDGHQFATPPAIPATDTPNKGDS